MFTCAKCVLKLLLWYYMYFNTAPSCLSQTQCAAASVVRKTVTTTHFYAFMFMQENRWSLKCIIQLWTLASLSSSSGIMQTALLLVFCQGIRVCCSTMYYCSSHGKYWLFWRLCLRIFEQFIIIIYPLTARVVGAPQMILQTVFSIFPCSPLPSGTCWTPGLSIPWCLPTSSSVCLVFFPISLCLARWFCRTWWTGNMTIPLQFASLYGRQVFVWSNCLLDLGKDFLVGNMVFVWDV